MHMLCFEVQLGHFEESIVFFLNILNGETTGLPQIRFAAKVNDRSGQSWKGWQGNVAEWNMATHWTTTLEHSWVLHAFHCFPMFSLSSQDFLSPWKKVLSQLSRCTWYKLGGCPNPATVGNNHNFKKGPLIDLHYPLLHVWHVPPLASQSGA